MCTCTLNRHGFDAVIAALTTPHHNGRTEGVNTRPKMLKRQMYGRAVVGHEVLVAGVAVR